MGRLKYTSDLDHPCSVSYYIGFPACDDWSRDQSISDVIKASYAGSKHLTHEVCSQKFKMSVCVEVITLDCFHNHFFKYLSLGVSLFMLKNRLSLSFLLIFLIFSRFFLTLVMFLVFCWLFWKTIHLFCQCYSILKKNGSSVQTRLQPKSFRFILGAVFSKS